MKSINKYDRLELTTVELKRAMAKHRNELSKADINDLRTIHRAIDRYDDVNRLCKATYDQFTSLRTAFRAGEINLMRYRRDLENLRSLLLDSGEKITNENLHAKDIASEILKYA